MQRRWWWAGGAVAVLAGVVGLRLGVQGGAETALDAALAHLPPGITVAHGAVSYGVLSGEAELRDVAVARNGRTLFTAADLRVLGVGPADATGTPRHVEHMSLADVRVGDLRIARAELSGVSPATLRAVFDPAAYPGGRPAWTDKRPVLDHAELYGISYRKTLPKTAKRAGGEVRLTVATQSVGPVRLSQLAAPPDYTADPSVLSAAVQRAMVQEGGSSQTWDITASGAVPFGIHVDWTRSGRFDGGRLNEASFGGLRAESPRLGHFLAIAAIGFRDLDMSGALALMPEVRAAPNKPHPELLRAMRLGGASLRGLRVDAPTGPLVTIDKAGYRSIAGAAAGGFDIHALRVLTTGRNIPAAARAQLAAFGMADFTADLDSSAAYDAATQTYTLRQLDVNLHDLADLRLQAVLNGVADSSAATPQQMTAMLAGAALAGARFRWQDHSLLPRLVRLVAFRQHTTPERLQAILYVSLLSLHALLPDQPDAADQVGAFLQHPHSLTVTLSPPRPVTLRQWQTAPAAMRPGLLGARVTGG